MGWNNHYPRVGYHLLLGWFLVLSRTEVYKLDLNTGEIVKFTPVPKLSRVGWNELPSLHRVKYDAFMATMNIEDRSGLHPLPEWLDVEWRNGFLIQKRRKRMARKSNYSVGNKQFPSLREAKRWVDAQPALPVE